MVVRGVQGVRGVLEVCAYLETLCALEAWRFLFQI